jgi:hypothetical protein
MKLIHTQHRAVTGTLAIGRHRQLKCYTKGTAGFNNPRAGHSKRTVGIYLHSFKYRYILYSQSTVLQKLTTLAQGDPPCRGWALLLWATGFGVGGTGVVLAVGVTGALGLVGAELAFTVP